MSVPGHLSNQALVSSAFRGKRAFVTGHTGFKGSWLCEWLLHLGADVTGYSLPPPTEPSLFAQLGLADRMKSLHGDIRNCDYLKETLLESSPDFVFHLAAQPLVRHSYVEPVATWETNVLGTINVLEALRSCPANSPVAAVMVTTDKVYENREWNHGYREEDSLGGYDPYSSSKAAAEIAVGSWRRSFFAHDHPVKIASARAGNVIGGGDWALDRIVPDAMRALSAGTPIPVRNPQSTRPWQHVLEPLSGYLLLAARLQAEPEEPSLRSAFNFGPNLDSNRPVSELIREILSHWPGQWEGKSEKNAPHEAGKLNLATDKAFHLLGWQPRWDFATTIGETVSWYRAAARCEGASDLRKLTISQIDKYASSCC